MATSDPFKYRLYLVTDEAACNGRDLLWVTEAAVKGGVDIVQLREKGMTEKDFLKKAVQMKAMLDSYNVPLIINDNLWVAVHSNASGVHVGNSDVSPVIIRRSWPDIRLIGYSIEYELQLQSENAALADYLALSPIFSTPTKTDTVAEWKLEGITHIRKQTTKPIVAIGSINESNAVSVIKAGADCLAVVSAICSAKDPTAAAERLRNEIDKVAVY